LLPITAGDDVVSRSPRVWVVPTGDITKATVEKSKFVGVLRGVSVLKIDSTQNYVEPFYLSRDATEAAAALLRNALGDRFENRRSDQQRRT
jgi:hypothetical protein